MWMFPKGWREGLPSIIQVLLQVQLFHTGYDIKRNWKGQNCHLMDKPFFLLKYWRFGPSDHRQSSLVLYLLLLIFSQIWKKNGSPLPDTLCFFFIIIYFKNCCISSVFYHLYLLLLLEGPFQSVCFAGVCVNDNPYCGFQTLYWDTEQISQSLSIMSGEIPQIRINPSFLSPPLLSSA